MDHNLHSAIVCYFRERIVSLFSQAIHSDSVTTAAVAPKYILVFHGTCFIRSLLQLHGMATYFVKLFLRTSLLGPVRIVQMLSCKTKDFCIWCQVCQNFLSQTDTCSSVNVAINIRETGVQIPTYKLKFVARSFFFQSIRPHSWGSPEAMATGSPLHVFLLRPTTPSLTT